MAGTTRVHGAQSGEGLDERKGPLGGSEKRESAVPEKGKYPLTGDYHWTRGVMVNPAEGGKGRMAEVKNGG